MSAKHIMSVKHIAKVLARRDGMSIDEALEYAENEMDYILDAVGSGEMSEEDAFEEFENAFGLEPDYLLEAII